MNETENWHMMWFPWDSYKSCFLILALCHFYTNCQISTTHWLFWTILLLLQYSSTPAVVEFLGEEKLWTFVNEKNCKKLQNTYCPNLSTTPIMACRQCLSLSVVQLKGKHCRKPHCRNGVVDTFWHWFQFQIWKSEWNWVQKSHCALLL